MVWLGNLANSLNWQTIDDNKPNLQLIRIIDTKMGDSEMYISTIFVITPTTNESICVTFLLWLRSDQNHKNHTLGIKIIPKLLTFQLFSWLHYLSNALFILQAVHPVVRSFFLGGGTTPGSHPFHLSCSHYRRVATDWTRFFNCQYQ